MVLRLRSLHLHSLVPPARAGVRAGASVALSAHIVPMLFGSTSLTPRVAIFRRDGLPSPTGDGIELSPILSAGGNDILN